MNPNDYVTMCASTALYPEEVAMPYLALGLCSEAAELFEASRNEFIKELGDCQWYICRMATHLGFNFTDLVTEALGKPRGDRNLVVCAGLIAGHIKKQLRDGSKWAGEQREDVRQHIKALLIESITESMDAAANEGKTYYEVLRINHDKLMSRKERGTLQGSGDNR